MEAKVAAEQEHREMTRAHIFISAGVLILSVYMLGLGLVLANPGKYDVLSSDWYFVLSMALGVPMFAYGVWCQRVVTRKMVRNAQGSSEQGAILSAAYKDITGRYRKGYYFYVVVGATLGLALYYYFYPRPVFNEWAFVAPAFLGFLSGSLVHNVVSLTRNRPAA